MNLRLAGIKTDSIVDGPGVRLAVYLQGCSHRCAGCHNPETHNPRGGREISVTDLVGIFSAHKKGIDGITLTGGEPFEQARPAAVLSSEIIRMGLNLVIYSGYTFETLREKSCYDRNISHLLAAAFLLVDGPFILSEQDLSLPYRGSRNQRLIDLPGSLKNGKALEYMGNRAYAR